MATVALAALSHLKENCGIWTATTTASAGDTFAIPINNALFGMFIYATGTGTRKDVTGITNEGDGTCTIGAGPSSKAGLVVLFGY